MSQLVDDAVNAFINRVDATGIRVLVAARRRAMASRASVDQEFIEAAGATAGNPQAIALAVANAALGVLSQSSEFVAKPPSVTNVQLDAIASRRITAP